MVTKRTKSNIFTIIKNKYVFVSICYVIRIWVDFEVRSLLEIYICIWVCSLLEIKRESYKESFKKTCMLTWNDRTPNYSSWFFYKNIYIQANSHNKTIIKTEDVFTGTLVRHPYMSRFLSSFAFENIDLYFGRVLNSFTFENTGAIV